MARIIFILLIVLGIQYTATRHRQTCVPVPGPVPGSDVPMFVIQCTAQALVLSLFKGLELQPMSGFVSVTSQDTMHPGTRLQD